MQEQIVGFEVAKLAKDKGFKELCLNYYFEDGELRENILNTTHGYYGEEVTFKYEELIENWNDRFLTKKDGSRCFGCNKSNGYLETCSAPTQALLQKWLREKHNIDVVVGSTYLGYNVVLWNRNTYKSHHISSVNLAEKYEDALEIGLIEAFKLIE